MNTNIILLFIIFILSEHIQKASLMANSEIKFNIFYNNTKSLHIVMNKLFAALKLNKDFKEIAKIELLLAMHNNLIKVIEKHHKLVETPYVTDKVSPANFLEVDENIEEILKDNAALDGNSTIYNHALKNNTSVDAIISVLSNYLTNFLYELKNLKPLDSVNIYNGSKENETRRRNMLLRNLKAWGKLFSR
jgi:hypothetical protein